MNIEQVAKVCHEVNRAYCQSIGDHSQVEWENAPEWQKSSAINGVKFHIDNPGAPASASHDSWLAEKIAEGWKFGPVKDVDAKEHPCCVPYDQLPPEQQAKDYIFTAIVAELTPTIHFLPTKVTPQQIQEIMDACTVESARLGDKTTVVSATLPNGFVIVESSSCVDPVNYDHEIGVEICLKRIEDKIWELEGYLLQPKMSEAK